MSIKCFYKYIVTIIILAITIGLQAQEYKITVYDSKNNLPIPFAHICFEGLESGQKSYKLTNENGEVSVPTKELSIISISYVGYKPLIDTIEVNKDSKVFLYPTIFDLDQVVVTASFVPQRVDQSIYKVEVIDRKDIELKSATNLSDALSNQVNIKLQHDAALGTSLKMKGLSGNNVKILIDGVPVVGRLGGNVDLSQLNLYNIDHIEIVEGPMSVIYGSNALAGAVNIITKESKHSKYHGSINTYFETVGTYNFDGWFSHRKGKHSLSLSGGRNFFNGYSIIDTSRWQQWKPKEQYNADLKYAFNKKNNQLKFQSSFMRERLWSKGELQHPYYSKAFDDWFYTTRFSNRLEFTKSFQNDLSINILGSHSFYQRRSEKYEKDLSILQETLMSEDTANFNAYTFRVLYGNQKPKKNIGFITGIDVNYEIGTGERIQNNEKEIGDYALFASLMYKINHKIMIQPGLRYAYNSRFNVPLVPSINLKWDIAKFLNLRASYARGYRAPTLKELYIYFVDINHNIQPNEDLKAEYGNNFDLSFSINTEKDVKTHYTNVDVSLFYNNMHNIIYLARRLSNNQNDPVYQYINILNYNTLGGQISFKYDYHPYLDFNLGIGETGTLASFSESDQGLKNYYFSPDANINTSVFIPKYNLRLSAFYKYTGKNRLYDVDENDNIFESTLEDYHSMDFSIMKKFFSNKISWTLGVKNIFDNKSLDIAGAGGGVHSGDGTSPIGYGRVYFTRLTFNFYK